MKEKKYSLPVVVLVKCAQLLEFVLDVHLLKIAIVADRLIVAATDQQVEFILFFPLNLGQSFVDDVHLAVGAAGYGQTELPKALLEETSGKNTVSVEHLPQPITPESVLLPSGT